MWDPGTEQNIRAGTGSVYKLFLFESTTQLLSLIPSLIFFINTFFCSCSITSSSVLFLVQLIFAGEGKAGIVIFYRGLIFY